MTTKTIASTYASGYHVSSTVTGLEVTATGSIGSGGLYAITALSVNNYGQVNGTGFDDGIRLDAGGGVVNEVGGTITGLVAVEGYGTLTTLLNYGLVAGNATGVDVVEGTGRVTNGSILNVHAMITGYNGVEIQAGNIVNFGTVNAGKVGAQVWTGGVIQNGSQHDTVALIQASYAALVGSAGTILNYGTLFSAGVAGADGGGSGQITNGSKLDRGALIVGGSGVVIGGSARLANYGTIGGTAFYGVTAGAGDLLLNGSTGDTGATINGPIGLSSVGAVTIVNDGTILGWAGNGVSTGGGTLTNGTPTGSLALIEGYGAVTMSGYGTVTNDGTLLGTATDPSVTLSAGGVVQNGSTGDTVALIAGASGVDLGATGTVRNFGTIDGKSGDGVILRAGGTLTNGSGAVRSALIEGITGVDLQGSGLVGNTGVIDGRNGYGVVLREGGTVTNGSAVARTALIEGYIGIDLKAGGTISNLGTIASTDAAGDSAVYLQSGGALTNGAVNDTAALIDGYVGVKLLGATASNFGTIQGIGDGSIGVSIGSSSLTNGSAGSRAALLGGAVGVQGGASATIVNFGTIAGTSGTALLFAASSDLLVDEAGSVVLGKLIGGGGTLDLAAGTGTLGGLGGSISGFGQVTIASGGHWTLAGPSVIAATTHLANSGALTIDGALTNRGTLTGGATLASGGRITNGAATGTTALISGATGLVVSGPATVTNFGTIDGTGGTALKFTSASDRLVVEAHAGFIGKVLGDGGVLELAAGTGTLTALGTSFSGFGTVTVDAGATWTLAGTSSLAAGTVLTDHGKLTLTGTLTDQAASVLDFAADNGIAGTGVLTNAGLIEKTGGSGTGVIGVAVANTGTVAVSSGTLDLTKAITGTGTLLLEGSATLEAAAVASGQTVRFTGAGETLEMAAPTGFKASISGFGAGDTLDLKGFTAVAGEAVQFTENAGNTGGTLKVTDGSKSVSVQLFGQYAAAGFAIESGSLVTYVPPTTPHTPPLAAGS